MKTNHLKTVGILLLFLFFSFVLSAQRPVLKIKGLINENNLGVAGVRITVLDNTAITYDYTTKEDGKFVVESYYSKSFLLIFEKPGYVTQQIKVYTNLIGLMHEDMKMALNVKMYPLPKDGTPIVFEEPMAKIAFDNTLQKFAVDKEYEQSMKPKLDALQKKIDDINNGVAAQPAKLEEETQK